MGLHPFSSLRPWCWGVWYWIHEWGLSVCHIYVQYGIYIWHGAGAGRRSLQLSSPDIGGTRSHFCRSPRIIASITGHCHFESFWGSKFFFFMSLSTAEPSFSSPCWGVCLSVWVWINHNVCPLCTFIEISLICLESHNWSRCGWEGIPVLPQRLIALRSTWGFLACLCMPIFVVPLIYAVCVFSFLTKSMRSFPNREAGIIFCVQTHVIGCCVAAYCSLCPLDMGCGDDHRSLLWLLLFWFGSYVICLWVVLSGRPAGRPRSAVPQASQEEETNDTVYHHWTTKTSPETAYPTWCFIISWQDWTWSNEHCPGSKKVFQPQLKSEIVIVCFASLASHFAVLQNYKIKTLWSSLVSFYFSFSSVMIVICGFAVSKTMKIMAMIATMVIVEGFSVNIHITF